MVSRVLSGLEHACSSGQTNWGPVHSSRLQRARSHVHPANGTATRVRAPLGVVLGVFELVKQHLPPSRHTRLPIRLFGHFLVKRFLFPNPPFGEACWLPSDQSMSVCPNMLRCLRACSAIPSAVVSRASGGNVKSLFRRGR